MPETTLPGPEEQPDSGLSEQSTEQEKRTALAHELVEIYGGSSKTAFDQIERDLVRDPDKAKILAIVIDLLAHQFLDDARQVIQQYSPNGSNLDLATSQLVLWRGMDMRVARAAITLAVAEARDAAASPPHPQ